MTSVKVPSFIQPGGGSVARCSGILANQVTTFASRQEFTSDGADQERVSLTQHLKTQASQVTSTPGRRRRHLGQEPLLYISFLSFIFSLFSWNMVYNSFLSRLICQRLCLSTNCLFPVLAQFEKQMKIKWTVNRACTQRIIMLKSWTFPAFIFNTHNS